MRTYPKIPPLAARRLGIFMMYAPPLWLTLRSGLWWFALLTASPEPRSTSLKDA